MEQVLETLRRHGMLRAGDRAGVAVSGGADSVALLLLLEELKGKLGIGLLALHFNHQLRGAESDADEAFVAELARARGLEFICEREDVAARAAGANLEETARQLRYAFFARVMDSGKASRIAVAHTADDQAETVLAHILRGTGPTGLSGIYPVAGHVVRPLLEVRRRDLREFLAARGQAWREDASNLDTVRLRARIRHKLLPLLEQEFQPAAVEHLASLAQLARGDEDVWRALLDRAFETSVQRTPEGLRIGVADLLSPWPFARASSGLAGAPEGYQRRLVRRIVEALLGHKRRLSARHVEDVLRLAAEAPGGHRVELPGVHVRRTLDQQLIFSRAEETIAPSQPYEYVVDISRERETRVEVAQIGKRFILKVIDWPAASRDTRDRAEMLDFERLRMPVVLRNWRPGDSYRPRGHRQAHKLKRLLWEQRIEARDRLGWPVLTSADCVVWARGLPVADEFAAQAGTRVGLRIDEEEL